MFAKSLHNIAAPTSGKPSQVRPTPFFQPKPVTQNIVQKKGENEAGGDANFIGNLIAGQLKDDKFKKHIIALGGQLQELALEATDPTKKTDAAQPNNLHNRFTALHIQFLFEASADKILKDPDLKQFRTQFSETVKDSSAAALAVALTGIMIAYLANIGAKIPEQEFKFGSGFSMGGAVDAGKVQDLNLKKADVFVKFAQKLFSIKLQGGVAENKGGALAGTGKGEMKIGTEQTSLTSALQVDADRKWVLSGKFSTDLLGQKERKFSLYTDVKWPLAGVDVAIKPGFSGKFKFGDNHSLQLGTHVEISSLTGIKGLEGFVEYRQDLFRIRIDGNLNGIPGKLSIDPSQEMKIQATVIIPLPF